MLKLFDFKLPTFIEITSIFILLTAFVFYGNNRIDKFLFILYYITLIIIDWHNDKKVNIYFFITRSVIIGFFIYDFYLLFNII
jgi:sugar phosphate permease